MSTLEDKARIEIMGIAACEKALHLARKHYIDKRKIITQMFDIDNALLTVTE